MILNRPSNLWLGASVALVNVVVLLALSAGYTVSVDLVAAVNAFLGAFIALVAGQPVTVNTTDTVNVKTSNGQPDKLITFNDEGFATTHDKGSSK